VTDAIDNIKDQAATIIEALIPKLRPDLRYEEESYGLPLEQWPPSESPSHDTRKFQIIADSDFRINNWLGNDTLHGQQTIVIRMRYRIPGPDDGGDEMAKLMSSDHSRLTFELLHNNTWVDPFMIADSQQDARRIEIEFDHIIQEVPILIQFFQES